VTSGYLGLSVSMLSWILVGFRLAKMRLAGDWEACVFVGYYCGKNVEVLTNASAVAKPSPPRFTPVITTVLPRTPSAKAFVTSRPSVSSLNSGCGVTAILSLFLDAKDMMNWRKSPVVSREGGKKL